MAGRILSISYDESLLRTRQWILEREGYEVTSALGFLDAQAQCRTGGFDLVIIGHSLPQKDKAELLRLAKRGCARRVLSLRRPGQQPVEGADLSIILPESPQELLDAVKGLCG